MQNLKDGLCKMVCKMKPETIKNIIGNHHFLNAFNTAFNSQIGIIHFNKGV